eukprot:CAMPEP_0117649218 /NCGR_PEP_ID=MMETSP0804-20121206/848_1 /TAXON_ID=1074897 /ORGANISM="Tetraselmis astigmatica, Strain CCMP880" /LENGTH=2962 /DNA_ID=CAMNT_0005454927 /DNA_START=54 /DNA_END=8942 /DNA_ORIENTATION=-
MGTGGLQGGNTAMDAGASGDSPSMAASQQRHKDGGVAAAAPAAPQGGHPNWDMLGSPRVPVSFPASSKPGSQDDDERAPTAGPTAEERGFPLGPAPSSYRPPEEEVERIIGDAMALERPPREVAGGWTAAVRELRVLGPPLHDSGQAVGSRYRVVVHTGDAYGMGTTAQVAAQVVGTFSTLAEERLRGAGAAPDEQWEVFGVPVLEKLQPLHVSMSTAAFKGLLPGSGGGETEGEREAAGGGLEREGRFRQLPNIAGDLREYIKKRGGRRVVDRMFASLDRDGSGALSQEELRLCLKAAVEAALGTRISRQDERVLCSLLDVSREGPMTQQHFEAALKTLRHIVHAVNAVNGWEQLLQNGSVFAAELREALRNVSGGQWEENLPPKIASVGLSEEQLLEAFKAALPDSPSTTWALLLLQASAAMELPDNHTTYDDLEALRHALSPQDKDGGGDLAVAIDPAGDGAQHGGLNGSGFPPSERRNLFALLRQHFKKNRGQLDVVWPKDTSLPVAKLQRLLKEVLDTRSDTPPPTGRELRLIQATMDVDMDGLVTRRDFETRMKLCRELHNAISQWLSDPDSIDLSSKVAPAAASSPGWSDFNLAVRQTSQQLHDTRLNLPWTVKDLSSRHNGRLDITEVLQLILRVAPDLKHEVLLCLLTYLNLWDSSSHSLLTLDDLRRAFNEVACLRESTLAGTVAAEAASASPLAGHKKDPLEPGSPDNSGCGGVGGSRPPSPKSPLPAADIIIPVVHSTAGDLLNGLDQSLPPQWWWQRGWSAEDVKAVTIAINDALKKTAETEREQDLASLSPEHFEVMTGTSLRTMADRVSRAIPRTLPLPIPAQWEQWHANVVLPDRPSGRVQVGSVMLNLHENWWAEQWRWHTTWWKSSLQRCVEGVRGREGRPPPTTLRAGTLEAVSRVETRMWPEAITEGSRLHLQVAAGSDPRYAALLGWPGHLSEEGEAVGRGGRHYLAVPPTVVPCCAVSFEGTLDEDAVLGDVCSVTVTGLGSHQQQLAEDGVAKAEDEAGRGGATPWYLERVEVMDMAADPPREWVLHHRRWVAGGQIVELVPDPHAWDEWQMGSNSRGEAHSVFLNANSHEAVWRPPPPPVLPTTPAAVPLRASKAMQLREGAREIRDTWYLPQPNVSQPARLRYLDDLPDTCRFATHMRQRYPLGLFGQLGFADLPVRVMDFFWPHAIAMHARGGLRPRESAEEAVMATWHLADARSKMRERYARFVSSVALDDSCGPSAASPVVFSVIADNQVLWKSRPLVHPRDVDNCNVPVSSATLLRLSVECSHSGSARAVWVDPHLLPEPLPPAVVQELSLLPVPGVREKVRLARTRDAFALRILPATSQHDNHCKYAVHLYTANDRSVNGSKAGLLLCFEGYAEFAPHRSSLSTPWLDPFASTRLRPGARASAVVTTVDCGVLSHLRLRCSKKAAAALSAVEVVHATTGESAFFVLSAGGRKGFKVEPAGGGSSEQLITVAREPLVDSPLYRVVLYTVGSSSSSPFGVELEVHGARRVSEPLYREMTSESADFAKWTGELYERDGVAGTLVRCGAAAMSSIHMLAVRMDIHKSPSKVDWRLRMAEVVHLGSGRSAVFDFSGHLVSERGAITRAEAPAATAAMQRVTVSTSTERFAGTDAAVSLSLYGKAGRLLDQELSTSRQAMEAGRQDVFFMAAPTLGELYKIKVCHDGSGAGADWRPTLFEVSDLNSGRTFVAPCDHWLRGNEPAQLMVPGHEHTQDRTQYHCVLWLENQTGCLLDAAEAADLKGAGGDGTGLVDLISEAVDWDVDDQYIDTLQETAAQAAGAEGAENGRRVEVTYRVTVTAAAAEHPLPRETFRPSLRLTLHGWRGSEGPFMLSEENFLSQDRRPFPTSGSMDIFQVATHSVGPVLRVEVECVGPWGLQLSRVAIQELHQSGAAAGVGGQAQEFHGEQQWLGLRPAKLSHEPITTFKRLLPVGCGVFTVTGKELGEVAALHLRHDAPGVHPGWAITRAEVFNSSTGHVVSLNCEQANKEVLLSDGVTPWLPWERVLGEPQAGVALPAMPTEAVAAALSVDLPEFAAVKEDELRNPAELSPTLAENPFSQLRAIVKAEGDQWPQTFMRFDHSVRGHLQKEELHDLIATMEPSWPSDKVLYVVGMLDLGRNQQHTPESVPPALKDCRDSHKRAHSMRRQLAELGPVAVNQMAQEGVATEQLVLTKMADQIFSTEAQGGQEINRLFQVLDNDGSGYLSVAEQTAAFHSLEPDIQDQHMRFLLAFLHTSDTDLDGRMSKEEFLSALAPFSSQVIQHSQLTYANQLETGGSPPKHPDDTIFNEVRNTMKANPGILEDAASMYPASSSSGMLLQPRQLREFAGRVMEGWPQARADHFASVVTAAQPAALGLEAIREGVTAGHSSHKAARGLLQELAAGGQHDPEVDGDGSLGGEAVLQTLADAAVTKKGAAAIKKAWLSGREQQQQHPDTSGGNSDIPLQSERLLSVLRTVPELQVPGSVSKNHIRFVLSYIFAASPGTDGDVTPEQLVALLEPLGSPADDAATDLELSDLFSRLLGDIKAEPETVAALFAEKSGNRSPDPKLDVDQIVDMASSLQPELMGTPAAKPHLAAMLSLGQPGVALDSAQLKTELKGCRDAHKQAKAVFRQLDGATSDPQETLRRGMDYAGPSSRILQTMGAQMREETGARAFQGYDKDGSGHLEQSELCKVARELDASVTAEELRFFLAFSLLSDSTRDGALSVEETRALLEPFMALPGALDLEGNRGDSDGEEDSDVLVSSALMSRSLAPATDPVGIDKPLQEGSQGPEKGVDAKPLPDLKAVPLQHLDPLPGPEKGVESKPLPDLPGHPPQRLDPLPEVKGSSSAVAGQAQAETQQSIAPGQHAQRTETQPAAATAEAASREETVEGDDRPSEQAAEGKGEEASEQERGEQSTASGKGQLIPAEDAPASASQTEPNPNPKPESLAEPTASMFIRF